MHSLRASDRKLIELYMLSIWSDRILNNSQFLPPSKSPSLQASARKLAAMRKQSTPLELLMESIRSQESRNSLRKTSGPPPRPLGKHHSSHPHPPTNHRDEDSGCLIPCGELFSECHQTTHQASQRPDSDINIFRQFIKIVSVSFFAVAVGSSHHNLGHKFSFLER